ncbi:OmpA family protein [Caballeronia arvi]|uniref:OmpA family protein n=1 Tax=Caballeronia arvi TaxID=1777135 RepID=UPI000B35BD78
MRITSLFTCSLLILSLLTCGSSEAIACSFAMQYGIRLYGSTTALSNEDRIRLAELVVSVRDSVADRGPVSVYGFADEHQPDAQRIADLRAKAVSSYLQSLGVVASRIATATEVWRNTAATPATARNQIEVEFLPRCLPGDCPNPCDQASPANR